MSGSGVSRASRRNRRTGGVGGSDRLRSRPRLHDRDVPGQGQRDGAGVRPAQLAGRRGEHGDAGARAHQRDGGLHELDLAAHGVESGQPARSDEVGRQGARPGAGGDEELRVGERLEVDAVPERAARSQGSTATSGSRRTTATSRSCPTPAAAPAGGR
jgi:hypothetical protein